MSQLNPVLITPECHAAGCHHDGDQYTMVKCRTCEQWYCSEHVDLQESTQLIETVDPNLHGISYYLGLCKGCLGTQRQQHPTNSGWLL